MGFTWYMFAEYVGIANGSFDALATYILSNTDIKGYIVRLSKIRSNIFSLYHN